MIEMFRKEGFKPLYGTWELTLRCNMNCLHCGSRAGKKRGDELTVDEKLRLADDLTRMGNRKMTLSGGEPLLCEEWPQVAKRLTDGGSRVNMISNGYTFTEETLEQAREAGLVNMGFSIDGDEEVHDRIRRKKQAFERVVRALDICAKGGFPTAVVTTINRLNAHMLEEMVQFFIDHGVSAWQPQFGFDYGNLSDHPDLLLVPNDLMEIIPKIAELQKTRKQEIMVQPANDVGYYTEEEQAFRGENYGVESFWLGCPAGLQVVGIEANGNIKGCLSMQDPQFVEGNIREEPFEEIWCKEGNFSYTRDFKVDDLSGFCRECQYAELCRGGCSWTSHLQGRGTGGRTNRYCLYRVYEEQGLIGGTFCPKSND